MTGISTLVNVCALTMWLLPFVGEGLASYASFAPPVFTRDLDSLTEIID